MSGIDSLFQIGQSALQAAQQTMTVIGQNVANVNTPGYSKQTAVLTEAQAQDASPGQVGSGVQVAQILRTTDSFLEGQLNLSQQKLGQLGAYRDALFQIQGLYGDSNAQGVGADLNNFFGALQDVATNPSDPTARNALLAKAATLTGDLNQTAANLNTQRKSLDGQVSQTINEVNTLASQIADLNVKISDATHRGQNANDLMDQRGQLLNQLGRDIGIATTVDASGQVSVYVGRGQVLVEQGQTRALSTMARADNSGLQDIGYEVGSGASQDITSLITGGKMKGLLDARDTVIPGQLKALDQMTAALTTEMNQQHRRGYGLDGSTGQDFFSPLSVSSTIPDTNTGTASVSASAVTAPSLLTMHDYEIRFSSATAYSIVDTTTGSAGKGNYTGTAITAPTAGAPLNIVTGTNDTLTVSVDGTASGTITLSGAASPGKAYASGADLATEVQNKINADATLVAAGKSVTVTYDTSANRLVITSDSAAASSAVNVTGGTARTALGLASGTSTASSGSYGSPSTLNVDGIQVTVTGTPAAGDKLKVNSYTGSATSISVALTDAKQVAAAASLSGGAGDNGNALALVALQSKSIADLGGTTFTGAYQNAATSLGVSAQNADSSLKAQQSLDLQLQGFRGQVSGVSMDEELTSMMQYQRMYQMAARLIQMTDEILQTLVAIKK
ncbi:MAG: flagellar hook-associated protein FlgK [Nitrospirota bacterium]|nr:flagellar hook-associated protein FlgK [Nitrospirota bacterium]